MTDTPPGPRPIPEVTTHHLDEYAYGVPAEPRRPEGTLHPELAGTVHYTDPRVRRLAQARWRLATGGTYQEWLMLGKDHPDTQIAQAREWMRAAVAAGILPPPAP
ncbi:hypothetical protein ACFY0N_00630 [Streptomyces vinaceus]|uniref:hypothetical protein n=1 Tax=Streptomyces vinaceus TaxID=1960 RepID=UPI003686B862